MEKEVELITSVQMGNKKESFEPLEMEFVEIKVENGYATSGSNDPITIQQWKNGNW